MLGDKNELITLIKLFRGGAKEIPVLDASFIVNQIFYSYSLIPKTPLSTRKLFCPITKGATVLVGLMVPFKPKRLGGLRVYKANLLRKSSRQSSQSLSRWTLQTSETDRCNVGFNLGKAKTKRSGGLMNLRKQKPPKSLRTQKTYR